MPTMKLSLNAIILAKHEQAGRMMGHLVSRPAARFKHSTYE